MTRNEMVFIVGFLNELDDRFSSDGCNDMFLDDTPENRELVLAANKLYYGEDEEIRLYGGKIGTSNHNILHYVKTKLMKEYDSLNPI